MRKRFSYKLQETEVSDLILDSFRLEKFDELDVDSLLLQTGYLTIKEQTQHGTFILDYPNKEVRKSFGQFLLSEFTETPVTVPYGASILRALDQNNLAEVIKILHDLIQAVPDHNYVKSEEKFFHAIVHLIFTMVGSDPRTEMHVPAGRIDTVIITHERIFIFEFKVGGTGKEALQCIINRDYPASLRHRNKPITGVGVVFSPTIKGIADWDKAEL
jgi:hypothetical protein